MSKTPLLVVEKNIKKNFYEATKILARLPKFTIKILSFCTFWNIDTMQSLWQERLIGMQLFAHK